MNRSNSNGEGRFLRFGWSERLEHGVLLVSFTVLAISGLPQKYPESLWGDWMIRMMGGIESTRLIHHTAAIVLILGSIYHLVAVGYKIWVRRARLTMLPSWKDVQDAWQLFLYNLRLRAEPPKMGRYTFGEKVEYWAVIWGTVIMAITGFMLWNPILVTQYLPGQFIPAAKAAHGGEAILAVLSILTWHAYHVHIKHFNRSMFTGWLTRHEMEEEHPLELAELEQGTAQPPVDEALVARRRRIYIPVAFLFSVALLIGLYVFATFETTAITTVPRQTVEVYTPATPTPAP
ncbi:MAG: hypothetical protein D6790_12035 [Caldilineae bacterium]|nr:MAG: hypothetical protein D6790_12035 [Caldilineae bacterium]